MKCKCCHREVTSPIRSEYSAVNQLDYCSIDCETDPNTYKDSIHWYLKNLTNELDCGDSSCYWKKTGGMRTNGGCRCFKDLSSRHVSLAVVRLIKYLESIYGK